MDHSFRRSVLVCLTTFGVALSLGAPMALAQDFNPASSSSESQVAVSDVATQPNHHHRRHHHRRGFFLGLCVGQSLMTANPPIALTVGKKPTKSQWMAIKAAKKACIAAFKAAHGSGGTSSESQE